jgi:hypothetical protein
MGDRVSQDAWVTRVLNVNPSQLGAPGSGISLANLAQARLTWAAVRAKAAADIGLVGNAIAEMFRDDMAQQAALAIALARVTGLAERLTSTLEDQLDAVLNAADAARAQLAKTARATLRDFAAFLTSDELMTTIDGNEARPDLSIAAPMRQALAGVARALG